MIFTKRSLLFFAVLNHSHDLFFAACLITKPKPKVHWTGMVSQSLPCKLSCFLLDYCFMHKIRFENVCKVVNSTMSYTRHTKNIVRTWKFKKKQYTKHCKFQSVVGSSISWVTIHFDGSPSWDIRIISCLPINLWPINWWSTVLIISFLIPVLEIQAGNDNTDQWSSNKCDNKCDYCSDSNYCSCWELIIIFIIQ